MQNIFSFLSEFKTFENKTDSGVTDDYETAVAENGRMEQERRVQREQAEREADKRRAEQEPMEDAGKDERKYEFNRVICAGKRNSDNRILFHIDWPLQYSWHTTKELNGSIPEPILKRARNENSIP